MDTSKSMRYKQGYELMLEEGKVESVAAAAKCSQRTLANIRYDRTRTGEAMARRIVSVMIYRGYLTPQTTVTDVFPRFPVKPAPKVLPKSDPMIIERGSYAAILMDWIARGLTTVDILRETLNDKKHKFSGNPKTEKAFNQVIFNWEKQRGR